MSSISHSDSLHRWFHVDIHSHRTASRTTTTTTTQVSTRAFPFSADVRRHGPGWSVAPYRSTEPEDSQGRCVEARDALHGHDPGPPHTQAELFSLFDEEPGGTRPYRMPTLSGAQEQVQRHPVGQIVDSVPDRRSMFLCRWWWNSWWTCSSSLTRSYLLPSRLSKCPRSSSSASRREPRFASWKLFLSTLLKMGWWQSLVLSRVENWQIDGWWNGATRCDFLEKDTRVPIKFLSWEDPAR